MRIGIDAKWYFDGPPSGKRVIKALVDQMLTHQHEHELVIFLDRRHRSERFPFEEGKQLKLCYIWAGNNAISNLVVLPLVANRLKLDVTLYQTFASPLDRGKRVAYIHDVLFLSNPEFYTLYERLYFSPLKFLTRRSHAVVTVSEEEKKRLLAFGFSDSAGRVVVAYHGVDPGFTPLKNHRPDRVETVRRKYKLPDKFILFVGRLNLRKNVANLLKAIPFLSDKDIPLVIVGADDWKKSNHHEVIQTLGIAERIHFTGAIYDDLPVVYALATVFCFPSHAESFGLPPLEAMAAGVPVVVSNSTSLPEVCGPAGTYVDPDQPQSIAAAIDNLLTNDQLYHDKRHLGLEQAGKFRWDDAAAKVLDCIASCVKTK